MRIALYGLLGAIGLAAGILVLLAVNDRGKPSVRYITTVDGKCLRFTGGGWSKVWMDEVNGSKCDAARK